MNTKSKAGLVILIACLILVAIAYYPYQSASKTITINTTATTTISSQTYGVSLSYCNLGVWYCTANNGNIIACSSVPVSRISTECNITSFDNFTKTPYSLTSQWLPIWTAPQNLSLNSPTLFGQLLDTFSNHVILSSVYKLNVTVYDQPGDTIESFNGIYINFFFNESEGCDDYYYLISAYNQSAEPKSITVYPNVTAKYNPSYNITGVCK
jgi:hypothetical protein